MDMEQRDYDSRTALHVAAAEGKTIVVIWSSNFVSVELTCVCFIVVGHAEVVCFLLEACKVNPVPKDR